MHQRAIENRNRKEDKSKRGEVMQVNQFIGVCLILIAMMAVAIFMAEVASNLVGWIMSIITVIFTAIFNTIVGMVLFIASVVIGLFSCVVFIIGSLIVYLKKKFKKRRE